MKILTLRRLKRLIQIFCLGLFLYLISLAAWPAKDGFLAPDFFLRLDPLTALAVPLAAREIIGHLAPGLMIILTALVLGRIFCGFLCPFGTTLDLVSWLKHLTRGRKEPKASQTSPAWRRVKYLLLAATLSAALGGISLIFWTSPIPLITRFYALLMHPLILSAADLIIRSGELLPQSLNWAGAADLSIRTRAFDTFWFILVFFGTIFWLEWQRPRFWCRVLCPAGALLTLFSRRPLWRRRVTGNCGRCGRCHQKCPAGAISPDGQDADYGECLICQNCVKICPVRAVKFSFGPETTEAKKKPQSGAALLPPCSRRAFISSSVAGLGLAWLQSSGLSAAGRLAGVGNWPSVQPVRPPGSRPEDRFLALCLRCGECIKACPTNALAPVGLNAGLNGLFSPYLNAERGPCEPQCHYCGQVCPTGAIAHLPLKEKRWAKMGTARVLKKNCLAWAEDRHCVVCQEVCPYGSIDLAAVSGLTAPVPRIQAARCFGCGYCEHHCPTDSPAIVVRSESALRLNHGDYQKTAKALGLDLDPAARALEEIPDDQLPPGFLDLN